MTHFSWHYANEGNKTEWLSVQRAGNEACPGSHVPLGHIVVSEVGSGRSRPLFFSGSWVSSSSWPWLEGWLPTHIPLERISSGFLSGSATSWAAIQKLLPSPALLPADGNIEFSRLDVLSQPVPPLWNWTTVKRQLTVGPQEAVN